MLQHVVLNIVIWQVYKYFWGHILKMGLLDVCIFKCIQKLPHFSSRKYYQFAILAVIYLSTCFGVLIFYTMKIHRETHFGAICV